MKAKKKNCLYLLNDISCFFFLIKFTKEMARLFNDELDTKF